MYFNLQCLTDLKYAWTIKENKGSSHFFIIFCLISLFSEKHISQILVNQKKNVIMEIQDTVFSDDMCFYVWQYGYSALGSRLFVHHAHTHTHTVVIHLMHRPVGSLWRCVVSVTGSSCPLGPAARWAPGAAGLCRPRRLSSSPGSALGRSPAPVWCGPPAQTDAWPPGAPPSVGECIKWVCSENVHAVIGSIIVFLSLPVFRHDQWNCCYFTVQFYMNHWVCRWRICHLVQAEVVKMWKDAPKNLNHEETIINHVFNTGWSVINRFKYR